MSSRQNIKKAKIHFEGSLQDFTDQPRIDKKLHLNPSAKDLVESCGVPHVEVFGLTANSNPVPFSYNVSDGDIINVFPKQASDDPQYPQNINQADQLPAAFVADVHLGKTVRYLRLMGIDTLYSNSADDTLIVEMASKYQRAALTRDVGLLKHGKLKYGYWLRSDDPKQQLREVICFFDLREKFRPFTLCMECNGHLETVSKHSVKNVLPERVEQAFSEFRQCTSCGKVYWKGSHYKKLVDKVKELRSI